MDQYPLEPEDEIEKAWGEVEQEWGILGDEWDLLTADALRNDAATLVLRKHLPTLINKYKAGMQQKDLAEVDRAVLKMDKHVVYMAQLYLNILEVGFDKNQAFVILCNSAID